MPGCQQSIPLDLSRDSEDTRRKLYDLVRSTEFTPEFNAEHPEDSHTPLYTAEDAGLQVFYLAGRWFARWNRLEVADSEPEEMRVELLRIRLTTENDWGFSFREC